MIWGTQRPGACSIQWVLAWNSSTLVRWRIRAGSSVSFSCSVRAWRCRNRACLDDTHSHTSNSKSSIQMDLFSGFGLNIYWYSENENSALSLPLLFLVSLLQHEATHLCTGLYVGQEIFNSLWRSFHHRISVWSIKLKRLADDVSDRKHTYFAVQAVVQLHERSFGLLWQFAQNLHSDLRQHIRDIHNEVQALTSPTVHFKQWRTVLINSNSIWMWSQLFASAAIISLWNTVIKGTERRQKQTFSHLIGDGAGILHRHHQVSSQEVDQDVGDVCAQGLQDVLGNVDLGFICMIKEFPLC